MAERGFDMRSAQPFIDQYIAATQPGQRAIDDTLAQTAANMRSRVGLGAGGSRHQMADIMAAAQAAQAKGDLVAQAGVGGLNFARQSYNQDIANRLNTAGALGQFGQAENAFDWRQMMNMANMYSGVPLTTHQNVIGPQSSPFFDWTNLAIQAVDAFRGGGNAAAAAGAGG